MSEKYNILVVLPTYRRLDQLSWSVRSIFYSQLPLNYTPRLCVASNSPEQHDKVQKIITEAQSSIHQSNRWTVNIIKREKTIFAIDNFYSTMHENANYGDYVFIHGDDDLMLPWGIQYRVEEMDRYGADMMLSPFIDGLLFDGADKCYEPNEYNYSNKHKTFRVDGVTGNLIHAMFIGGNVIRYSEKTCDAIKLAFHWSDQQEWIDRDTRTSLVPLYIAFAAIEKECVVIESEHPCVMLGRTIDELRVNRYGNRGCNHTLLYGLGIDVVKSQMNISQGIKDKYIGVLAKRMSHKYYSIYFDQAINAVSRRMLMSRIGDVVASKVSIASRIRSVKYVIGEYLKIRRITVSVKLMNRTVYSPSQVEAKYLIDSKCR